jgi:uncharacterized cupredoxin-like copper-binding protein
MTGTATTTPPANASASPEDRKAPAMREKDLSESLLPMTVGVMIVLLALAVFVIVGLAGRPAGGIAIPTGSHVIHVSEVDYKIILPAGPLPAGNDVFVLKNTGTIVHELVMFKTKSANAVVALDKDGALVEDSPEIKDVLDSGSGLQPGETRILGANLEPGTYILVCNLPGHYKFGMHLNVTVK